MASAATSVVVFMVIFQTSTQTDLFASISDMETLVNTQGNVIENINRYIAAERQKMDDLERLLKFYKQEYDEAMKDVPYYVQNPINSYSLIKRLTVDLDYLEAVIKTETEYIRSDGFTYPNNDDLTFAAEALGRIQDVYRLDVKEISNGKLVTNYSYGGDQYVENFKTMSCSECYAVGKHLFNENNYERALLWLLEAYSKWSLKEDDLKQMNVTKILEPICLSYIETGHITEATRWVEALLSMKPNFPDYEVPSKITEFLEKVELNTIVEKPATKKDHLATYKQLCRGEIEVPADITKGLTCRYLTENHPFLRIAPIKAEQLYLDPPVMLFHEVVSDSEIEDIKKEAKLKKLLRAGVRSAPGTTAFTKNRISKTTWLKDTTDTLRRLSRRLHDFTGLNLDTAESLQIANYGIGGVYEPHHDFIKDAKHLPKEGHRIATVLFYLSDVTQGGATVFVELGLTVYPVKGSALFWMNLEHTGELDYKTLHGACPVLRGTKWAGNRWIHSIGQEFVYPCRLNK